jgi:hypothetical protein
MPIHFLLVIIALLTFNINRVNGQAYAQDAVKTLQFYSPCTFPVAHSGNVIQNREVIISSVQ